MKLATDASFIMPNGSAGPHYVPISLSLFTRVWKILHTTRTLFVCISVCGAGGVGVISVNFLFFLVFSV